MSRRAFVATAVTLTLGLGAAGCGDDGRKGGSPAASPESGGDGQPAQAAGKPADTARLVAAVQGLRSASVAQGCEPTRAILHSSYPDVQDASCQTVKKLLDRFRKPKPRRYGGGAVVDFVGGGGRGSRRSAVLALDSDGAYKLAFVETVPGGTNNSLPADEFKKAAEAAVAAIDESECQTLGGLAHQTIGIGSNPSQLCAIIPEMPLKQALDADSATPAVTSSGGNSLYAFFDVRAQGKRFTVVMAQQSPPAGDFGPAGARYAFVNAFPAS